MCSGKREISPMNLMTIIFFQVPLRSWVGGAQACSPSEGGNTERALNLNRPGVCSVWRMLSLHYNWSVIRPKVRHVGFG